MMQAAKDWQGPDCGVEHNPTGSISPSGSGSPVDRTIDRCAKCTLAPTVKWTDPQKLNHPEC